MKTILVVLIASALITLSGCVRQKDLPAAGLTGAEKVVLADRYPTTPEEIKLVEQLSKITEIFKVLYKNNTNVRLVNASKYAGVFSDECVLLADLIFPSQSRLLHYPRFDSLTRVWQADLSSFANHFWHEVAKRNDTDLEQFLQTLVPHSSTGNQYSLEDEAAPPVSVYYPYSETFSSSSVGNYLPTVSLLTATADTDQAPGSEPVYENGSLTGYVPVLIDDDYASSHSTHIIGVNGPEQPVGNPGGGLVVTVGGVCFSPGCNGPINPQPIVPTELKRSVLIDNYILKTQYDNLISFTGNGGGSELRINRISAHLQPAVGPAVSAFSPLPVPPNYPAGYTIDQGLASFTRQEIRDKVWKETATLPESRWDMNWAQSNHEQALAVWEYDNTSQRAHFNGELYTSLMTTSPTTSVNGFKSYAIEVPSHHPPIKHLRILRATYFGEARNDFGFGFRAPYCVDPYSPWTCSNWSDYAGLSSNPNHFVGVPPVANQVMRWPARDVHWDTKVGAAFGWVWPYRVYYVLGGYPSWVF
jgi:hypothetical protein